MNQFVFWHSKPSTLESIKYKFLKTLGPTMIMCSGFEFESLHQDLDLLEKPQVSPVLKLSLEPSHKNKA